MLNAKVVFYVGLVTNEGKLLQPKTVIRLVSNIFKLQGWHGFTVTNHYGYWKGTPEQALSFTVFIDSKVDTKIIPAALARTMAKLFKQEAVLWSVEPVHACIEYAEG